MAIRLNRPTNSPPRLSFDEMLPISGLQHLAFCPRQCLLSANLKRSPGSGRSATAVSHSSSFICTTAQSTFQSLSLLQRQRSRTWHAKLQCFMYIDERRAHGVAPHAGARVETGIFRRKRNAGFGRSPRGERGLQDDTTDGNAIMVLSLLCNESVG